MTAATQSTARTVREEIIAAIRSIAATHLGFDENNGNIRETLLDYRHPSRRDEFLLARVSGKPVTRCWAVEVTDSETFYATGLLLRREYTITVRGYYDLGVNDEGVNLLIDHAEKVREAILNLGPSLGGRVSYVPEGGALSKEVQADPANTEDGWMIVGTMQWTAIRDNPDF